jgi:hypothetical protein
LKIARQCHKLNDRSKYPIFLYDLFSSLDRDNLYSMLCFIRLFWLLLVDVTLIKYGHAKIWRQEHSICVERFNETSCRDATYVTSAKKLLLETNLSVEQRSILTVR